MEKITELFLKIYPIEGVSVKRRILLHCIFWGMMSMGLWKVWTLPTSDLRFSFIIVLYIVVISMIYFYLIMYKIIPLWENNYRHKYLATLIGIIVLIVSIGIMFRIRTQFIFDNHLDNYLIKDTKTTLIQLEKKYKDYMYIFKYPSFLFINIIGILLNTLPAFFIKLTHSLIKNISEKKQIEIDYLRSQINPHFLTNTLNNIYSLSVKDDKRNSDAILSLSSLLDYVLYEANQPTISLEKEVSFLSNFIELEKMRNTKRLQVSFEVEGNIHGNIPPMLLITFVENAFKHSIGDLFSNCFINILLKVDNGKLYFEVQNSKSNLIANSHKKTFGGIGLTNVKKRLATLFPDTHSLQIENKEDLYIVKLKLKY
ncbi:MULTISPECIES: histidine kinase [unclassified Arcicella]|uniref:sensor histidine kinase n=1 Tax=unclassified Arcicella TaxID=2644986 RepID=UPI00285AA06E|nr:MULTISPECIES: histidine kinase [unclassified Arcicella]MDR6563949.1 sensor histidine kinase YesM [Arcicella sp. BE51]MDR6813702.1 sensor histidine kinase YesM [Arcicella sp. BE140]MDR6824917.1 sensor histidine kinase YesM [Arcicella sp. BE139]